MIIPKKTIQDMAPYCPPTSSRLGKVRLDFNENTTGCSPKVIESIKNVTPEMICSYPEYSEIKELVAKYNNIYPKKIIM